MARAEAKAKEYEEAIRNARTEVYKDNDVMRKKWREEQTVVLANARERADSLVKTAKAELASDVRAARESLQAESERIADGIAAAILRRSA
jgi:F0F1-type ATP synthase membrane subunit b/b'